MNPRAPAHVRLGRPCLVPDADLVESLFSPNAIIRSRTASALAASLPLIGVQEAKSGLDGGLWSARCVSVTWCSEEGIIDGAAWISLAAGGVTCSAAVTAEGALLQAPTDDALHAFLAAND